MAITRTTDFCPQCSYEKAFMEVKEETYETFLFCTKCGYTQKYLVAEDEKTTSYVKAQIQKLYEEGKYKEALIYVGYNKEMLDCYFAYDCKKQVELLLKNPPRSPIYSFKDGEQHFKYEPVIRDGFGTYKYTDEDGNRIVGRFVNENHRNWKIKQITKDLKDLEKNGKVEVYSCDKDEVVERVI